MKSKSLSFLFIIVICFCELIQLITTACAESCSNCSSSLACLQCSNSNYMAIASVPTKGCLPCRPGCKTCTSQYSLCSSCLTTYFLNATTSKCQPCLAIYCDTCDQTAPQICTICSSGYYLIESSGTCQTCSLYPSAATCRESMILSCRPGYYVSGGQKCLSCGANCLKCSSPTYCLTCKDGYFGSSCTSCHSSCQTCSRSTACLTCKPGYYQNGSLCNQCPSQKNPGCISCDTSAKCTKCSPQYYLDYSKACVNLNSANKIIGCNKYEINFNTLTVFCKECQIGYFLSSSGLACLHCSILCSNCSGLYATSSCSNCTENLAFLVSPGICSFTTNSYANFYHNYYLSQWNYPSNFSYLGSTLNVVNQNCPNWKFSTRTRARIGIINGYNFSLRIKLAFSINNNSNLLDSSYQINMNGYSIYQGQIQDNKNSISQCSEGLNRTSFEYTQILLILLNSSFNSSLLAPSNTQVSGNSNYLQILSLSANFYVAISELSILYHSCHQSCALCQSDIQCVMCKDTGLLLQQKQCVKTCGEFYYQLGSKCLKICPAGTYENSGTEFWQCTVCPKQCKRCDSQTSCASCNSGYFLLQEKCVSSCPSQYFANSVSARCDQCSAPCLTCNSSQICLSCRYNFLYNSSCLAGSDCPSKFYPNISTMSCLSCESPCETCQTKDICKTCLPGAGYLYKGKCYPDCPIGYLKNTTTRVCSQCSPQCFSCHNTIETCLKCAYGFYMDGRCLTSCSNGFYENYTTMQCKLCKLPCLTCRSSPTTCKLCQNGYILHEQTSLCLLQIQCSALVGSFLNVRNISGTIQKNCINCPSQCLTCTSATSCQSCKYSYFLLNQKCLNSCPFGYYSNKNNSKCELCSSNCITCSFTSTLCTSCPVNYRLNYINQCQSGCLNINEVQPNCQKCEEPCYTCQNSTTTCLTCVQPYFLDQDKNTCLQLCYNQYFADWHSKMCLRCSQACYTCTNSSDQCTSCPSQTYLLLHSYYYKSGVCVKNCPSKNFPQIVSTSLRICQLCQEPCLECFSVGSKCLSCLSGVLNDFECIPECPTSKYLNITNNTCKACSSRCLSCYGPLDSQCYSCNLGYYYLQSQTKCNNSCPIGYLASKVSLKCQPCQFPCLQCSYFTTNCTKCWQNTNSSAVSYYLYKYQCLNKCPSLTYALDNLCISCKNPCHECLTADLCLTCADGNFFLLNKCYIICPSGYYQDQSKMVCRKCEYPCKTCTSQTECISCIDGIRIDSTCSMIDQCSPGQYLRYSQTNGICQKCSPICSECEQRFDKCKSCANQTLILFDSSCIKSCPIGYYLVTTTQTNITTNTTSTIRTCSTCASECIACTSISACTVCSKGYNLIGNKCVERCPPTHYKISQLVDQGGICKLCSSSCKTCVNYENNCLSCYTNYFWYQFKCLASCQEGTYYQNSTQISSLGSGGICRQCIYPCKICQNSKICRRCLSGFYLYEGSCIQVCKKPLKVLQTQNQLQCIQNCPSNNFVLDIGTFLKCSSTCSYPYLLSTDKLQCLLFCPNNSYIDSKLQCQPIPSQGSALMQAIPKANVYSFVDKQYKLKLMIEFNVKIKYEQGVQRFISDLQIKADSKIVYKQNTSLALNSNSRLLSQDRRDLLTEAETSSKTQYRVLTIAQTYISLQLNPSSLPYPNPTQTPSSLTLTFKNNSNTFISSKLQNLPLQASSHECLLPIYEAYTKQFEFKLYYQVFGEVIVFFVLAIGLALLVFNWYAKMYQFLHFCQLIFLFAAIQVQYPPNLWLFLQGFKHSHFYFIQNWFVSDHQINRISDSPPKISAIFVDSNFIRIFGHFFCLIFVLAVILFILFLGKFIRKSENRKISKIGQKMFEKCKLVKWSHTHDIVMTFSMLLAFSFLVQMKDYKTISTLQILGIILSYIMTAVVLAYYIFMAIKLHKMVKMSIHDPQGFSQKRYLFREDMLSITEYAVHPKQLYLNYLRTSRVLLFGFILGAFSTSPMLCVGSIGMVLVISALIHLISMPYSDKIRNILIGCADLSSLLGLFFIALIHFQTVDFEKGDNIQEYLLTKWRLGWTAVIFILVSAFLLLAELLVSIVKGNSCPLKLPAQDPRQMPVLLIGAPKLLEVRPKKQLRGWQMQGQQRQNEIGYRYEKKEH